MKQSNTVDEVFVYAPPPAVFRLLDGFSRDASWWPGARTRFGGGVVHVRVPSFRRGSRALRFSVRIDRVRAGEGMVWNIERGDLHGTGEWWLEASSGGTAVHYFLNVRAGGGVRRWPSRVRRHRNAIRVGMNALKDYCERAGASAGV